MRSKVVRVPRSLAPWPDALRGRDISYNAALRQLSNRLVGILHGCLKTGTHYNEAVAWHQHAELAAA